MLRFYAKQLGKTVSGTYFNEDTKETIFVSNRNISEICCHAIGFYGIMTSISAIPDIIRRSIFISEEENTKKNLHPYNDKYQYFLSGLKIKDDYFTVKSVIAIDQNNNRYYDHYIYNHPKELYLTTKKPRLIFRRDTS